MPTLNVTLDSKVVQGKGNIVSDMDGSKVMLSIENGKYYNLGSIGGDIWDLISEPTQVKNVVENLLSFYEVDEETCINQVKTFLLQLLKDNLITLCD